MSGTACFLIRWLHEDLNKVKQKPYVELKDLDSRRDDDTDMYKAWNDSAIVNACQNGKILSVTFVNTEPLSGTDIDAVISGFLSPLHRVQASSKIHNGRENGHVPHAAADETSGSKSSPDTEIDDASDRELSFRIFLTDECGLNFKPLQPESLCEPCYLSDLPEPKSIWDQMTCGIALVLSGMQRTQTSEQKARLVEVTRYSRIPFKNGSRIAEISRTRLIRFVNFSICDLSHQVAALVSLTLMSVCRKPKPYVIDLNLTPTFSSTYAPQVLQISSRKDSVFKNTCSLNSSHNGSTPIVSRVVVLHESLHPHWSPPSIKSAIVTIDSSHSQMLSCIDQQEFNKNLLIRGNTFLHCSLEN
ncbi:unnamed protein product [Thlaspi arvense]|uniref:Uncharacterized protein n=1 Tax=Thlaspi arvense TaxID=13288 RepID=A0AAU9SVI6_THLAR|nr:unnamed protein product [Thlaspi arvense]